MARSLVILPAIVAGVLLVAGPSLAQAPASGATAPVYADPLPPEAPPDYATLVDRVLTLDITPGFAALRDAANLLDERQNAFCAAPSAAGFAALDEAFAGAALAWAAVVALPINPLVVDSRRERFFFWPDPRGLTLRQIQPVIADRDESVTDPTSLAGKSIALQGLGALEYILYGTGAETLLAGGPDGDFRCRYATAVTANLVVVAEALAADTGPDGVFTLAMRNPGAGNALYSTADRPVGDIVVGAAAGIELGRDSFLVPVTGLSPDLARPRLAPLWRSGLSVAFLTAVIDASRDLVRAADLTSILPADRSWIQESLEREFAAVDAALAGISAPIDAVGTDLALRDALGLVIRHGDNLKSLLKRTVPLALGLSGFNFADGD